MNPNTRRKLPASLRTFLTDISPRLDWRSEPDPEPDPGDGIPDPGPEELLSPAGRSEVTGRMCMLCCSQVWRYTCPRCHLQYCGLTCYQSPGHASCSEDFYKDSVLQELKVSGASEAGGRRRMQEILVGLRQEARGADGGMRGLLQEAGVLQGGGGAEEKVQAVDLLTRLAEIQESDQESDSEIQEILRKLEGLGGESEEEEEEEEDLPTHDVDHLSEEQLWDLLKDQEKEKFLGLLRGGAIGGLVPVWLPWWEEHQSPDALVQVLEDDLSGTSGADVRSKVTQKKAIKDEDLPPISPDIPELSSLCSSPSALLGFSLVNVIFCYTFSVLRVNGDTESLQLDFIDMMLSGSEAFSSSRVFCSVQEAVSCAELRLSEGGHLEDSSQVVRAVEAAAHVLTGRDGTTGYCLAALSHLRRGFMEARRLLTHQTPHQTRHQTRRRNLLAEKKCQFLQAWVQDHSRGVASLALELWLDHRRRAQEADQMNRSRSEVEKFLRTVTRAGKTLVEEVHE